MCVVAIRKGDPYQVIANVVNNDLRPVVGLTGLVLLSIINAAGEILDFNDLDFKASGITQPNIAMSEFMPVSQPIDITGDTDGSTGIIAGMTDTSDFKVGMFASVSAGFEDSNVAYKIITVTGTSITLEINSDSIESNITVTGWFQPGTYFYSFLTAPYAADTYQIQANVPTLELFLESIELQVGADRSNSDLMTMIEALRPGHTHCANAQLFYIDPVNGDSFANGNRGGINDPLLSVQDCHDNLVVSSRHDAISILPGNPSGTTILDEAVTLTKRYLFIYGPGRDLIWTRSSNGDTIDITGDGISLAKFQLETHSAGSGKGVHAVGSDFFKMQHVWVNDTRGTGIHLSNCSNCQILDNILEGSGVSGSGQGIEVDNAGGPSDENVIRGNIISAVQGDAIKLSGNTTHHTHIIDNKMHGCTGWGVNIQPNVDETLVVENESAGNDNGDINDQGTDTHSTTNSWDIDTILATTNNLPNSGTLSDIDTGINNIEAKLPAGTISDFDESTDQVIVATNNDKSGYSLSVAGIKAIWDQLTNVLTTAGSIGKALVDHILAVISAAGSNIIVTTDNTVVRIGSTRVKTFLVKDLDGDPIDISSFTTIVLKLENMNDSTDRKEFTTPKLIVTDGPNGVMTLTPGSGDFTEQATYKGYFDMDGEAIPDHTEIQISVRKKILTP